MANRKSKFSKEVKALNISELKTKITDIESHMFQLRMQLKTGQLSNTAAMGLARKELAKVKTFIAQKEAK